MIHALCGLKVATDLPLPDLQPWPGDGRPPDVDIRLGTVPPRLTDVALDGPLLQIAPDGTCRFAVAGIAAYLVEDGRRITVEPYGDAGAPSVRVFLLGSVFGFLCHQRGLLPLHAGCVEIDGRAVLFAGPSGAGKSTLTATFLKRGHRVLSDDITVVDLTAPGGPMVPPSFPRIKLWRDAAERLDLSVEGLERSRPGLEKFHLPVGDEFGQEPLPLGDIYHLSMAPDARHAGISRLRGRAAMDALVDAVYRRRAAIRMGRQAALMADLMRLAARPTYALTRIPDLAGLDETAALIVARHQDDGG